MSGRPEITRATDEGTARRPLRGAALPARRARRARQATPHSEKFRVVTAVLAIVALGAVALAVAIVAGGRGHTSAVRWSSWSPPDKGHLGETEIAEHVAPLYRGQVASDQLDIVTLMRIANPNATAANSGFQVAVQNSSSSGSLGLLGGSTVAYDVCGIGGPACALGGTPSANRLLLLRREALELALYTFKYVSGTSNVLVVLPPGHTETTSQLTAKPPALNSAPSTSQTVTTSVLFVRQELQPWLSAPLADTLQAFPPALSQLALWKQTTEANLVDQITGRGLFSEKIEQAQDGTNLIVLTPLPPQ